MRYQTEFEKKDFTLLVLKKIGSNNTANHILGGVISTSLGPQPFPSCNRVTLFRQLSLAEFIGQRSMKTAKKCSRDLDNLRLEGQKLGPFGAI